MMTTDLYPYQEEALERCLDLGFGLVAYDMGLGKTAVGIALVEELLTKPDINFALIIVPTNLKYQWAQAIVKFTDVTTRKVKLRKREITVPEERWCVVVDGPKKKRLQQYEYVEEHWPNYVVVSYEQVVNDFRHIKALGAECIILDEATYIKGFRAARAKRTKELGSKADFTYALSGTPVENRVEELYSIMEFVDPGYLGSFDSFDTKYIVRARHGGVDRYRNLDVLHRKMSKVMTRKTRLDSDVAPYLPSVSYRNEYVFFPPKTQRLYDKIATELASDLRGQNGSGNFDLAAYYSGNDDGSDMSELGKAMAKAMALQMLCDDWRLLEDSAAKYRQSGGLDGSKYAAELAQSGALVDLEPSAKLAQCVEDVSRALDNNQANKVIIFSFFKGMVRRIQEALDYDSVTYTGDMTSAEKEAARDRFQYDPKCRIFIATDAGAYGVDLPQANFLWNFEQITSAGKMSQRNARHVRAGSAHANVLVGTWIVDGSIDERVNEIVKFRRSLAAAAIDGASMDGHLENTVGGLADFIDAQMQSGS